MAPSVCYDGLPSFAVRIFQRRPFESVGSLTKGILKIFLTRNNQKFKISDNKEGLVLRCEKYINRIEDLQRKEKEAANPPPEAGDRGNFPACMICLEEGTGKFALIPCGHTGCCSACSASVLNTRAIPQIMPPPPPPSLPTQTSTSSGNVYAPGQPGTSNQGGGLLPQVRINLDNFLVPRPATPRFGTRSNEQEPLLNQPVRIGNLLNNPTYIKCPICQARSTFVRLHFA